MTPIVSDLIRRSHSLLHAYCSTLSKAPVSWWGSNTSTLLHSSHTPVVHQ